MLGRDGPGSEGNLASDFENQEQSVPEVAAEPLKPEQAKQESAVSAESNGQPETAAAHPEGSAKPETPVAKPEHKSRSKAPAPEKAEKAETKPAAAEAKPVSEAQPVADTKPAPAAEAIPSAEAPKAAEAPKMRRNARDRGAQGKPNQRRKAACSTPSAARRAIGAGQERRCAGPGGAQGHEHPEAQPDRQGSGRAGLRRTAQAGADLQDPAGAGGKERADLLRRRARMPARRLRLPARARVQLSARPRRRVRLALADPPLRSAHRRHRQRADPAAQGRRAVLRADQGRRHQLRAARGSAQQDFLRQPDAALSAGAAEDGDGQGQLLGPRDGSADAHRQGTARADRGRAAHRQDHAAAVHRQLRSPPIIRK